MVAVVAAARAALCRGGGRVSEMLQFGQSSVAPHWRQNTDVEKPRPVEEQQRLLAPRETLAARAATSVGAQDDVGALSAQHLAHVDDARRRREGGRARGAPE